MTKQLWELKKCEKCGKPLIPDLEAVNFVTKKWDGHTYKYNCDCHNNKLRVSIG